MPLTDPMAAAWLQFSVCAGLIAFSGAKLCRYADVIADKTGVSANWIGLILLATVTSLPELVTGISSVTAAAVPDIAVGDALGSCVLNLAILVILDFLHREEPLYRRASQGHILSAGFGIVLIGFAALNLLAGGAAKPPAIGHIGFYTPVIIALYLAAVRAVFLYERHEMRNFAGRIAARYPDLSLRQAALRYLLAAAVVLSAGIWLPFSAASVAVSMGWHNTFMGTTFVATATSLPELAVTVAALRAGAVDMAIANLLGSNLFDVLILALDDLFYLKGPLLSHVSPLHAVSAVSALVMTGIAIIGLLYRAGTRLFAGVGWASVGLLAAYILNTLVLYLARE